MQLAFGKLNRLLVESFNEQASIYRLGTIEKCIEIACRINFPPSERLETKGDILHHEYSTP
jgi:hypothetical protein